MEQSLIINQSLFSDIDLNIQRKLNGNTFPKYFTINRESLPKLKSKNLLISQGYLSKYRDLFKNFKVT